MVSILEKTEHNTDYHQIVNFLEASYIRIKTTDQETKIIATVYGKPQTISESSLRRHLKLNDEEGISSLLDAEIFENLSQMGYQVKAPTETLTLRRFTTRVIRIAQSKALSPNADEPASLSRDDRYGEDFPTVSSLDVGQDRENIAKTSAMSYESSPRVSSLDADEDSMQQRLHELMELCTSLQRQKSQMADKLKDKDIEISGLKARGIINIEEELGANKSTEKGSNDTKEIVNVLSSMEATNILSSGGTTFSTASVSLADVFPTAGVPTVSGIFTTASVATPYTGRSRGITVRSLQPMRIPIISAKDKGKEKVTETEVPKKKTSGTNRCSGLDRSNEVIAKHLSEYEQAEADLSVGEKIELIRAYQFFVDMLKQFDREDLHQLWILVKETFSIKQRTRDKEKELWVELKRLFEPDYED
nr:hypothetical protein [Tanacetum cinerariifolium]